MELNKLDVAIILASLRMAQTRIDTMLSMDHFDDENLDASEVSQEYINDLCERINCSV